MSLLLCPICYCCCPLAEDYSHWLFNHDCFPGERVSPEKARIIESCRTRVLQVVASDGSREFIYENGRLFKP